MKINLGYENSYSKQLFSNTNLNQKSLASSDDKTLIRRIPTTNDRVIEVNKSNNSRTRAYILDLNNNDNKKEIRDSYLPKELKLISDPFKLDKYLRSTWVKVINLSDGDNKIEIISKVIGGGGDEDIDDLFDSLKTNVKSLTKESRLTVVDELKKVKTVLETKETKTISATESRSLLSKVVDAIKNVAEKFVNFLKGIWEKLTSACRIF